MTDTANLGRVGEGVTADTNGNVGIGTSSIPASANVFSVYGTSMSFGNIVLQNRTAGGSGIYFADGTFQTTAGGGGAGNYSNTNVASYLSGPVVIGNLTISNTTASTSTTTGALLMGGGIGVAGNVISGGNLVHAGASSLSFVIASNSIVGSSVTSNGIVQAAGTITGANIVSNGDVKTSTLNASSTATVGGLNSNAQVQVAGTATVNALIGNVYGLFGQNVTVNSTNASTATTNGALVVAGGIGLAGNVYAGGNVVAASFQPTSASIPGAGLYLPTTSTLAMSTSGVERMRITSTGNVVIGTSASLTTLASLMASGNTNNSASPLAVLDAATISIKNDSVASLNLTSKLNFNVASIGASVISGYYAAFNASNDIGTGLQFGTQTNAAGGTVERMRIDQNGNVGIATSTIQTGYKLQVQGNAAFTNRIGIGTSAIAGISNSLVVYGSAMVYGNVDIANPTGGTSGIYFNDGSYQTTAFQGPSSVYSNTNVASYLSGPVVIGNLYVVNTTVSTSTASGAVVTNGGVGVAGNIYAGGNIVAASTGATVTQFWASVNDTAAQPGYAWDGASNKGIFNAGSGALGFSTAGTERMRIDSSGNVGVNTSSVSAGYKMQVNGAFAATSKSFVIKHPTKPGMLLRHGSLEGPENAVYVRGRLTGKGPIELPDYWRGLVDESTITVNLTPVGSGQQLVVGHVSMDGIRVFDAGGRDWVDCYYMVLAERSDVPRLVVEE